MFDDLEIFDGEIANEVSQSFMKHYFAGYKSFTKHGGKNDHKNYQMHYLDMAFKAFQRYERNNKYAIKKKVKEELQKKKIQAQKREAEEQAKQKRDEKLHNKRSREQKKEENRLKRSDAKRLREQKKEENRIKRLDAKRLREQKKEENRLQRLDAKRLREQKKEEQEKSKAARKRIKSALKGEQVVNEFSEEEIRLLAEAREELRQRHIKELEGNTQNQPPKELLGALREGDAKVVLHYVGKLGDFKCKYCKALLWKKDIQSIYCGLGQVCPELPSQIKDNAVKSLYDGTSQLSERFLNNINRHLKQNLIGGSGLFGDSEPETKGNRKNFWKKETCFLDLYFYHDSDQQIKLRTEKLANSKKNVKVSTEKRREREERELKENEDIIKNLYEYMVVHNACLTGMLKEVDTSKGELPEVSITLKASEGVNTREHKGVYHLPSSSSHVGAIVNLDSMRDTLSITVDSPKPGSKYLTKCISHNNFFYDPFQYPLIILDGDIGYSYTMRLADKADGTARLYGSLTPRKFYASLYMEREGVFNYLTKCRRLFQQFAVDNYVKVESTRLSYIEHNQKEIRKERSDVLRGEDGKNSGQRIVIPPTYVGGPRYMKQRQQDALAFVTNYGSPGFFITFTMNLAWEELSKAAQQTGSHATSKNRGDRPDLVSRIFKLKVDELMDDLTNKNIFGRVKVHLYSIEWQKRGLPHVHILLWIEHRVDAELVGRIISAEIPDKEKEPRLFETVTTCMIHGPCKGFDESQACCQGKSVNGKDLCGKGFPKPYRDNLLFGNNGLFYHEVPNFFFYEKNKGKWTERKTRTSSLGRIRAVTSKTVELFYMRLLLTHKRGPTSFTDLRTGQGVTHPTFREAVKAMGLLNDEETWKQTIMEIINHTNDRKQLRSTYASMLVFSDLEDQSNIWEETKDLFASDFLYFRGLTEYNDEIYLDALDNIQENVLNCGGGRIVQYGLPPSRDGEKTTNVIRREKSYNKVRLAEEVEGKKVLLNEKQRFCYETVMARVEGGRKDCNNGFFLDAPGGTGKYFVLNIILDTVRSTRKIALAVASSGIAATVLHGGRTAHNMFKIPLMEYNEVRSCSIKKNSEMARLLRMTSVIVWDEAVMANRNTIAALDITLRDILEVNRFMGGIFFVCAGDFRQILPVIRGGGKNDELEYCIKSSYFWDDLIKLELTENERAIISATNDDVDCINLMVYDKSDKPEKVYRSEDTSVDNEMDVQTSVYNSMTSPSLPLHELSSASRTANFTCRAPGLPVRTLYSCLQD
ncbi:uncharacterized protein LOC143035066 [Oratosquilla oratoria]|uniref:uncharacterized protein LOC143035066 n=1 Tax=Oratosquilla oratoria TaxID=337810 RepID=UPI003F771582